MVLVIGSRMPSLREVLNVSGPVHTLREKITPERVVTEQKEENKEDSGIRISAFE
jgi:hypothetical protein